MRKIISFRTAANLSLSIFGLIIFFHLIIILGIILFDYVPIDFLWGGQMESKEQLLVFELISLAIMILCFFIVIIRSGKIRVRGFMGISRFMLWVLFILFALNTVGNIFAETTFEKFFAIVTVILTFLCLRLALGEKGQQVRINQDAV